MIYTFYSYKGGVGRSMALANLAKWFYLRGLRVVVIDWDLEAPGLENFFYSQQEVEQLERVNTQLGLIDMLLAYKRQFPLLPQPEAYQAQGDVAPGELTKLSMAEILNKYLPPLSGMLYRVEPSHSPRDTGSLDNGALWLLPAGWRSGNRLSSYVQAVQDFDWSDFYAHFAGHAYFDWLRDQLNACSDVVLIDSRTGVTEMSGVSTQHLADVVVSLCAPNIQNLQGVFSMAKSFKRLEVLQARGENHPLEVIVVPARIDSSELAYRNAFEKRFKALFDNDEFTPAVFRRFQHTLWDLCIPYVAQYTYADKLVVGDDEGAAELKKAYDELAVHMVMLTPEEHILRQRCADDLQLVFEKLSPGLQRLLQRPLNLFISYVLEDGAFVHAVVERLRLDYPDIIIHDALPHQFAAKEDWREQLSSGLDRSQGMLVILSRAALRSSQLQREWRYARQRGICIYPLITRQPIDLNILPNWIRRGYYEYNKRSSWQSLIIQLRDNCQARAIPFMAPSLPAGFVKRVSKQQSLLETTLSIQSTEPPLDIIALHGPAGSGKTILAAALCQEEAVQDAFEDGILWVTLGVEPSNVIGKIEDLLYILSQEKLSFNSIEAASMALARLLEDRKLLLVIDDVWKKTDLKPFLQGGEQCVRLITTRDASVISRMSKRIKVEAMNVSEARQMLLTNIDAEEPDLQDQESVEELIARLDHWPLLLELANSTLQQRLAGKDSLTGAIHYLRRALKNHGIVAFDQDDISERNQSIAASIELSLQQLKVDERQFCQHLASFTPYDVSLSQLVASSEKMSAFDVEELLDRLDTLSLLTIDYRRARVSLYKVICDYLLTKSRP